MLANLTGAIIRDCLVDSSLLRSDEYELCHEDKCNDFNFPRDRLLCQQCEDCDHIQKEPKPCRYYSHFHMACVTFKDHATDKITRGCQWTHDVYCRDPDSNCVYCLYDDCNRDPRKRKISIWCYFCDLVDGDCYAIQDHTEIREHVYSVPMGEMYYCWTIFAGVNNGPVFRFHQFDEEFSSYYNRFCGKLKLPSPQCARCFGSFCNKHFRTGKCFECIEDDPDCGAKGTRLIAVSCEKNYLENYGCYGLMMGERSDAAIRRGCTTDLDYLHEKSCVESESCFFCRGDYCNHRAYLCYFCNDIVGGYRNTMISSPSGHEDDLIVPSCVNVSQEHWPTAYCGTGDSCFLLIQPTMYGVRHERGCMSGNLYLHPSLELVNPALFQLCNTHLCNDWEAINDTHWCYDMDMKAIQCPEKSNYCFTSYYLQAQGHAEFGRGCYNPQAKFQGMQRNCDRHIETCRICAGSLCNDGEIKLNMTMKCVVCNNRKSCMYYDVNRQLTKCVGEKYFFESETCFYGLDLVSKNITRGCTMLQFPGRKTPPANLFYCARNGCNFQSVNDYQCYQCDSNAPNSAPGYCFVVIGENKEVLLRPSACEGETIFQEREKGCYTYYTPTGVLKRGCIRHLTAQTIDFCSKNQTFCKLCFEEECNVQNTNGAWIKEDQGSDRFVSYIIIFFSIYMIRWALGLVNQFHFIYVGGNENGSESE